MSAAATLVIFSLGLAAGAVLALVTLTVARRGSPDGGVAATQLGDLLEPLRDELARYDQRLTSFDRERAMQFGALSEQLHSVAATSEGVRDQAYQLSIALRTPSVKGRWGEVQLRRVVELAGMAEHCDFDTQVTTRSEDADGDGARFRPDMLIRLPGGRSVIVDAKAPLSAYLDANDATDDRDRSRLLRAHAAQVRSHVNELSRKSYWEQFGAGVSPEFVVLFLPGEAFFSAALEQDGALLEDSAARGVILATPTTLIAILKSVAFGWREARMADSAREISTLGATLYDRLATLGDHFTELGRNLEGAVASYNRAVGSMESRVFVTARRLRELGAAPARVEIGDLQPVDARPRNAQLPDFLNVTIPPAPIPLESEARAHD